MSVKLKPHQLPPIEYMKTHRGLIIYHSTGSGKTLTALYSLYNHPYPIIIIGPKSSKKAFKDNIEKASFDPKRFTFYTYVKVKKILETEIGLFRDASVIIDEAHNLRTENLHNLYIHSALVAAAKVVLLTATPVVNYMNDLAVLVNIARGEDVLPTERKLFDHMFYDDESMTFINSNILLNKLKNTISYYKMENDENYPTSEMREIKVVMGHDQMAEYIYYVQKIIYEGRTIENVEDVLNIDYALLATKKKNFFLNVTRQLSNVAKSKNESPKIEAVMEKIEEGPFPILIYSNFLSSGIYPLAVNLEKSNISYETITGYTTDDKLNMIVNNYNKGLYKVLFISSAGSESLDFKNTRQIHILEPHWNESKIKQVIGRAIRYLSHSMLPVNQRNVIIYRWISVFPSHIKNVSADEYLTNLSNLKYKMESDYKNFIIASSIENNFMKPNPNLISRIKANNLQKYYKYKTKYLELKGSKLDPDQIMTSIMKDLMKLNANEIINIKPIDGRIDKIIFHRLCGLFDVVNISKYVWKKVDTTLTKEYQRYIQSRKIKNLFKNVRNVDINSMLERWFILRANGLDADTYSVEYLQTKKVFGEREAREIITKMHNLMADYHKVVITNKPEMLIKNIDNITHISYGDFKSQLETVRYSNLVQGAIKRGYTNPVELVTMMMLRYTLTYGNYRQFAGNPHLYQKLVDDGATIEGFASPFNAQILITYPSVTDSNWNPKFCSMYLDTDRPFGSIGSFFYQEFKDKTVALFPPTVESIIDSTVEYIHSQIKKFPCIFQLILPIWEDLNGYIAVSNSKYLISLEDIDSKLYPSIDPYSGKEVPSGRKFKLFVIGRRN